MANVKEKPIWKFKVTGEHETPTKSLDPIPTKSVCPA